MRVISPSAELLRTVRAQMEERLPPREQDLLQLLGVSDFLTAMTVAHQERAVGRIVFPFDRLEAALSLLAGVGLCVRRAGVEFTQSHSPVESTDHARSLVPAGTPGATHGIVYFGVAEDLVEGAEAIAQVGQQEMLAQLFGYPECCARAFGKMDPERMDRTPDTITDTGPFPRQMNPCLPYLTGLQLLFHFPCSPRCAPSRELRAQRLRYLSRLAPMILTLEELGAGIALYGPKLGIALVTRAQRVDEETERLDEVLTRSEHSRDLLTRLEQPVLLRLRSPHTFELNGTLFEEKRGFVARFE
jgi:hypothetical protein